MFNFYSVALLHVSAVYSWGAIIDTDKKKKNKKKSKLVSKLVLNNCCIIFSYIGYVIVMSYLTYISKNDFS